MSAEQNETGEAPKTEGETENTGPSRWDSYPTVLKSGTIIMNVSGFMAFVLVMISLGETNDYSPDAELVFNLFFATSLFGTAFFMGFMMVLTGCIVSAIRDRKSD